MKNTVLHKANTRGHANHGWLNAYHSFSFASWYNPERVQFGVLRVLNDDTVAAGMGFGTHPHDNMEIITIPLEGDLAHKDSMGNVKGIPPGDVQRMSAGSGVQHSEFNHAKDQETHFLQIWIEPNISGIAPSYEQKTFANADKQGKLKLVASPTGAEGSVTIHANADLHAGLFNRGEATSLALEANQKGYVHLVRGELKVNGVVLRTGDAAKLVNEQAVHITDAVDAEVLVFVLS